MNYLKYITLFVFIGLFTACGNAGDETPAPSIETSEISETNEATQSPMPSAKPSPTPTPMPTSTPVVEMTPSATPSYGKPASANEPVEAVEFLLSDIYHYDLTPLMDQEIYYTDEGYVGCSYKVSGYDSTVWHLEQSRAKPDDCPYYYFHLLYDDTSDDDSYWSSANDYRVDLENNEIMYYYTSPKYADAPQNTNFTFNYKNNDEIYYPFNFFLDMDADGDEEFLYHDARANTLNMRPQVGEGSFVVDLNDYGLYSTAGEGYEPTTLDMSFMEDTSGQIYLRILSVVNYGVENEETVNIAYFSCFDNGIPKLYFESFETYKAISGNGGEIIDEHAINGEPVSVNAGIDPYGDNLLFIENTESECLWLE